MARPENVPASHSLVRPPAWNGTPRGEPRTSSPPDSACTTNSLVGRSAYGPVRPYGVIEQTTRPGWESSHTSGSNSEGGKLSITTSASATSASTWGSPGRPTTERMPWCRNWKSAPPASGSICAPPADQPRQGSPPGGSTFTTSAPASQSRRAAYPPGMPVLKSTTRSADSPSSIDSGGPEVRQREAAFHLVELDRDLLTPDQVREDLPALVHVDDDRDVGHLERRHLRAPHRGPAVDRAGARARLPREVLRRAVRAQVRRCVGCVTAHAAALEQQLV